MEVQNFLLEYWEEIIMVILIAVVSIQHSKVDRLEETLKNLSYLKSRTEFDSSEIQQDDKFLHDVLVEFFSKLSDQQLMELSEEQNRKIKRISHQTIQENSDLQMLDRCRLTRAYVEEEILRRKNNK